MYGRLLMDAIRPENAIKSFKSSKLFPINKSEVENKIVFTGMTASDKSLISPSVEVRSELSTSSANNNLEGVDESVISNDIFKSPLKDLKRAILITLSSPISGINKKAVENSKRKRKRVQAKIGEVLTETAVVQRLERENEDRIRKNTKKVPQTNERNVNLTNTTSGRDTNTLKTAFVGSWMLVNYEVKKIMSTICWPNHSNK